MKHAAATSVDDSAEFLRSQDVVALHAGSLRAIAAERFTAPEDVIQHLQLNEAADLLVTLVMQREEARDLAARLEAEVARLEEDTNGK